MWETCLQIFLNVREVTKKTFKCIRGKNTSWNDLWQKMCQSSLGLCFSKYIKYKYVKMLANILGNILKYRLSLASHNLANGTRFFLMPASTYIHFFITYTSSDFSTNQTSPIDTRKSIVRWIWLQHFPLICILKNLLLWLLLELNTAREESGTFLQETPASLIFAMPYWPKEQFN